MHPTFSLLHPSLAPRFLTSLSQTTLSPHYHISLSHPTFLPHSCTPISHPLSQLTLAPHSFTPLVHPLSHPTFPPLSYLTLTPHFLASFLNPTFLPYLVIPFLISPHSQTIFFLLHSCTHLYPSTLAPFSPHFCIPLLISFSHPSLISTPSLNPLSYFTPAT